MCEWGHSIASAGGELGSASAHTLPAAGVHCRYGTQGATAGGGLLHQGLSGTPNITHWELETPHSDRHAAHNAPLHC